MRPHDTCATEANALLGLATHLEAEEVANALLAFTGVTRPPVPVYRLARAVGIVDIAKAPIGSEALLRRPYGFPAAILRRDRARSTQRFSLAHEIGHLLLDVGGWRPLVSRSMWVDDPAYQQNEATMEFFAASLLLPAEWLTAARTSGWSVLALSRRFDVPPRLLGARLRAVTA